MSLFRHKNNYDKSEEYYKKAIRKNDKLADAYNNLAWVYCLQRKNLDEAEELVKKQSKLKK